MGGEKFKERSKEKDEKEVRKQKKREGRRTQVEGREKVMGARKEEMNEKGCHHGYNILWVMLTHWKRLSSFCNCLCTIKLLSTLLALLIYSSHKSPTKDMKSYNTHHCILTHNCMDR